MEKKVEKLLFPDFLSFAKLLFLLVSLDCFLSSTSLRGGLGFLGRRSFTPGFKTEQTKKQNKK